MKKLMSFVFGVLSGMLPSKLMRKMTATVERDQYTRLFLKQIHNPHIRQNVQTAVSPRDAAIVVIQDAFELAGNGECHGKIEDIREERGLIIVDYSIFDKVGSVAYMPLPAAMRGLHVL